MVLRYRGGGIGQKVDPGVETSADGREPGHGSRTHTRHPLGGDRLVRIFGEVAHHLPTDRGGPNRAATARPVARTSGLALRVFRSPFAGSSPLWLRDGVGGPTIGRTARRGAPAPRCGAYSEANPLTRPNLRKDDPPDGLDRAMSRRFYGEVPPATLGGSGQVKGRSLKSLRVREQRLLQRRRPPRGPGRIPLEPQGL